MLPFIFPSVSPFECFCFLLTLYSCIWIKTVSLSSRLFLSRGADIDVVNKEGDTPLSLARPDSPVWVALQINRKLRRGIANRIVRTERIICRSEFHPVHSVHGSGPKSRPTVLNSAALFMGGTLAACPFRNQNLLKQDQNLGLCFFSTETNKTSVEPKVKGNLFLVGTGTIWY